MRKFLSLFLSLILVMGLCVPVSAAGVGSYKDVPDTSGYRDAIQYVSEMEYMTGFGDETFRPDNLITYNQLGLVLARISKAELVNETATEWLFRMTYLTTGLSSMDAIRPDVGLAVIGRASGVLPRQAVSSEKLVYMDPDGAAFMKNAGLDLNIFDWNINNIFEHEYLTRGDLAYLIYRVIGYRDAHPEITSYGWGYIPVVYTNVYKYLIPDVWDDIIIMPWPIVKHYHDSGYMIICDNQYLSKYARDTGCRLQGQSEMYAAGMFNAFEKAIFIREPNMVVHGMGHYAERFMFGVSEAEASYQQERFAATEYISHFCSSDSGEFFAECFEFYIRAKNGYNIPNMYMMKERVPETYAYLVNKDVMAWVSPVFYVRPEVVASGVFPHDGI